MRQLGEPEASRREHMQDPSIEPLPIATAEIPPPLLFSMMED